MDKQCCDTVPKLKHGLPKQKIEIDGTVTSVEKVVTAVIQDKLLATAFHPELTADTRWFVDLVKSSTVGPISIKVCYLLRPPFWFHSTLLTSLFPMQEEAPVLLNVEKPADLPVFSTPIA